MNRLVVGVLLVGLVMPATSAHAAPNAVCGWERTDLPVPQHVTNPTIWGISGDGTYVVGTATFELPENGGTQGVLWHDKQWVDLVPPVTDGQVTAWPRDVNGAGTVIGKLDIPDVGTDVYVSHRDGTHQTLGSTPGRAALPVAINETGDVLGNATIEGRTHAVVWRVEDYSTYVDYGEGTAVGIDERTKVYLANGTVIGPRGHRSQLDKPTGAAGTTVSSVENESPVGFARVGVESHVTSWHDDRTVRFTGLPGFGFVANKAGTVVGSANGALAMWRNGGTLPVPADPAPHPVAGNIFITPTDDLIGTHRGPELDTYAAFWKC